MQRVIVGGCGMMSVALALWTLVAVAAILVAGTVPAFLQIRRTARQAEEFLRIVELELRPMVIDLKEAIRNLNHASETVSGGLDKMAGTVEAVKETGQTIRLANELVQQSVFPKLVTGAAVMTGLRVGLRTLFARLLRRKGR